jgi:HAE1 family hydrophobic/amphiphilic exporter-1
MGTAVIGGMLAASALGIFFIPAVFYVVERLSLGKAGRAAMLTRIPAPGTSQAEGGN